MTLINVKGQINFMITNYRMRYISEMIVYNKYMDKWIWASFGILFLRKGFENKRKECGSYGQ